MYVQDDSTPSYLYYTGKAWWVSNEENMQDCLAVGFQHSKNDCDCPERCTDACSACGAGNFGAWKENTGAANNGGNCDDDHWCPSGMWVV